MNEIRSNTTITRTTRITIPIAEIEADLRDRWVPTDAIKVSIDWDVRQGVLIEGVTVSWETTEEIVS